MSLLKLSDANSLHPVSLINLSLLKDEKRYRGISVTTVSWVLKDLIQTALIFEGDY